MVKKDTYKALSGCRRAPITANNVYNCWQHLIHAVFLFVTFVNGLIIMKNTSSGIMPAYLKYDNLQYLFNEKIVQLYTESFDNISYKTREVCRPLN